MSDSDTGNSSEFKSKWVVPTAESRAELAEWGLRTREQQDDFYRAMAEGLERLHLAELETDHKLRLSREAVERALRAAS